MNQRHVTELIRMGRFEDVYGRFRRGELSCSDASNVLGCSERHFLRLRRSFEEDGISGLVDGRVGKRSPYRAADEETELLTGLYRERYQGMSVAHFHEYAVSKHGLKRSYNWTRTVLKHRGLVEPSRRGGPHRLRRPRKAMRGMMLHQDGSRHEWVPGQVWDLIATQDDATGEILSALLVEEEGTESSFQSLSEVIERHGLFCSLYTDRGSHYFYTPEAGGKVDKHNLTQVGRALKQLGIKHIPAYSPQARGRSERLFGTLQDRLVQELKLEGITEMEAANRYLKEIYVPKHNARFAVRPESEQSAFMPMLGIDLRNILCLQDERVVHNDNTVRYEGLVLQIPPSHRQHYVKANVQVRRYLDGDISIYYGPLHIGTYTKTGQLKQKEENKKNAA